uniref:Uncharacterized protein n=1 Tax=Kwoniella pini CBS 10737 TaxID=1296096 RepID=A0A1B9HUZ3_9TREE|nr:uncharacterized protein I206_06865 [Kwoniella pini CBS 10737]OCF47089.1 hypothetical protein I206_06865 [Kwoniella pini CBS 10737]
MSQTNSDTYEDLGCSLVARNTNRYGQVFDIVSIHTPSGDLKSQIYTLVDRTGKEVGDNEESWRSYVLCQLSSAFDPKSDGKKVASGLNVWAAILEGKVRSLMTFTDLISSAEYISEAAEYGMQMAATASEEIKKFTDNELGPWDEVAAQRYLGKRKFPKAIVLNSLATAKSDRCRGYAKSLVSKLNDYSSQQKKAVFVVADQHSVSAMASHPFSFRVQADRSEAENL